MTFILWHIEQSDGHIGFPVGVIMPITYTPKEWSPTTSEKHRKLTVGCFFYDVTVGHEETMICEWISRKLLV